MHRRTPTRTTPKTQALPLVERAGNGARLAYDEFFRGITPALTIAPAMNRSTSARRYRTDRPSRTNGRDPYPPARRDRAFLNV